MAIMLIRSLVSINADLFSEPEHFRKIAFAGKGMVNPSREAVSPFTNSRLFRLGHSHFTAEENLSSP